jgi:hypothetical protein
MPKFLRRAHQKQKRKAGANSGQGEEQKDNRGHRVEGASGSLTLWKPTAESTQQWL